MDDIMNLRFRAKSDFIHRKVAQRDIVIPVAGNVANFNGFIELNETAAFLWEHLKEACTGIQLCHAIQEEFDVTAEIAESDIADFLTLFFEQQMIEVV